MFLLSLFFLLPNPTATIAGIYTTSSDGNTFTVPNLSTAIGSVNAANLEENLSSSSILGISVSDNTATLPSTITSDDLLGLSLGSSESYEITATDKQSLEILKQLYNYLGSSPNTATDHTNIMTTVDAIDQFLGNSILSYSGTLAISPLTFVEKRQNPVTVTASYGGPTDGLACYMYAGDGVGTYYFKYKSSFDDGGVCKFSWDVSGTEITTVNGVETTNRGVFVTFQSSGWNSPEKYTGTISASATIPDPAVTGYVVLVHGTESAAITLKASSTAVKQGTSVTVTATVSDPDSFSDKACYIYMGDGTGTDTWLLKGSGTVEDCSATWDTSGSAIGDHSWRANLQPSTTDADDPKAIPQSSILTITVCARDATDCGSGSASSSSSSAETETATLEAFNGYINPSDLLGKIANPNLRSVEGTLTSVIILTQELIGVLAFIATLVGGILVIISGGDASKAAKGKKSLLYGIAGMVIASLSYVLVVIIIKMLKNSGLVS